MLKVDFSEVNKLIRDVNALSEIPEKAQNRALKRSGVRGRTMARKGIREQVNLTATYIDKYLKLIPATSSKHYFIIRANYRGTLLTRFSYRQLSRKRKGKKLRNGVSLQVKSRAAGGQRKRMPGAFLIALRRGERAKEGAIGLAIREGGKIKVLHGPSTHQVLNSIKDDLTPKIVDYYEDLLEKELDFRIKRWSQKRS